jgi:regulator of RNase E activity RraA/3-hydroxyisobutyrate dehydrogenase-like beta-hydroxyacid dehydrogenase
MHVAVLGLGEAGALYASACTMQGWEVTGYDPGDVPTPDHVVRAASIADAVLEADVVLGLTGARAAVAVATEAATAMRPGACLADMNSGSSTLKTDLLAALEGHDVLLADVAVIGPVPSFGARTPLIISGAGSTVATSLFTALGADVDDIGGAAGDAARRKLVRSSWMKGVAALIVETLEAGREADLEDWTRQQVADELAGGSATMDRLYHGTYKHAARRAHEMRDATQQIADAGLVPVMARATAALHQQLAEGQSIVDADVLRAWQDLPVANIGDARGRLGITRDLQAPWRGATMVGRARTVTVAGGDNVGIQRIVEHARPHDVIVVDGQADASRALVGELLAGRLIAKGVAGMVIDGAIRDAEDLQDMGFPIWHRARNAAGPYKNGPFHHGEPVSVGGVVCLEGDLVVADGDGVTFVRPHEAPALLPAARAVQEDEAQRRAGISAAVDAYRRSQEVTS